MQFKKSGTTYFIRLERGEEIVETLTRFIEEQNITAGSISGIGAANKATLQYYDIETKEYHEKNFQGAFEILALNGNVSLKDGKLWPHLHIVLSDTDYHCIGGHLESATVGVTCEVVIHTADTKIERVMDEETQLKLWSL